ncbi:MAG: hypothetical protein K0R17_1331 [Rariglobus sp.]|jgi:hypothetical protein|nr:hypothetical protein [Rariglobus sp.]
MAFSFRHLIRHAFVVTALLIAGSGLRAQPVSLPPATFQLYAPAPLGDLFYDLKGRPVSIHVGHQSFSAAAVVPPGGNVVLYRFKPAAEPGLPPVREPVLSAAVTAREGAQTLLLIYPEGPPPPDGTPDTRPLRSLVFDQSAGGFPHGTIRVFSFSARPVAMKIGPAAVPVPSMQTVIVPYPDDRRTWLHIATIGEQGWQRVIGTPQTLGPRTRLSLFLRDIPPSQYDPKPIGLLLGKILETIPETAEAPRS